MTAPLRERNTITNTNTTNDTKENVRPFLGTKRSWGVPPSGTAFSNGVSDGKSPRKTRISKSARKLYSVDFFAILALLSMATIYMIGFESGKSELYSSDGSRMMTGTGMSLHEIANANAPANHMAHLRQKRDIRDEDEDQDQEGVIAVSTKKKFEEHFSDAPSCRSLNYNEVTFSLALGLNESDIVRVSHHCHRWGISAPISIAVWTELSPEQVMDKLKSFKHNQCAPEQMTIATLSPSRGNKTTTSDAFPLNQLRNLAIQGIQTSHVISLDIEMWPSAELYDILHTPSTVKELARDPKLAVVLPAFEVDIKSCRSSCWQRVPATFEALVIGLSEKRNSIMGLNDIDLQGSTNYNNWINQVYGELKTINCVSSNYYEPYVAVRYCQDLPPFQEVLRHDDSAMTEDERYDARHDMTSVWTLHLLRLGYTLKQLGGGFVLNLPDEAKAKATTNTEKKNKNGGDADSHNEHKIYGRRKLNRTTFLEWLETTVPDQRFMSKCDDFDVS